MMMRAQPNRPSRILILKRWAAPFLMVAALLLQFVLAERSVISLQNTRGSGEGEAVGPVPEIASSPITGALAGRKYTYDVETSGEFSHRYTLTAAPADMAINTTTGEIFWTPNKLGVYDVTVEASNASGIDRQSFTLTVYKEEAACTGPIRIMPLGDSITKGSGSATTSGYRRPLYLMLTDSLYDINMVGSVSSGQLDFDHSHEGHGGWQTENSTVHLIAINIYDWLVDKPADIVLLHIGTTDISNRTQSVAEIGRILDEIDRYSEDVTVIVAKVINRRQHSPETTQYNKDIASLVSSRIENGDKLILVDMESALDYTSDMDDNVHPNDRGYAKMADVWYSALKEILPICLRTPSIQSTPVTVATDGELYLYDVDASGNPAPTYSLSTAPNGMTINPATGRIRWTPGRTGSYKVLVSATNSEGSDTQAFTLSVSAPPTPTPVGGCGPLIQEAEAGSLGGVITIGIDGAASGGKYIHVPDGTGNRASVEGNPDRADYCFTVSTAGTYRLKGWSYADSSVSNSFFVQIGDHPTGGYNWIIRQNNLYQLDYLNNERLQDPVEVTLSPGQHQVSIYLQEDGTRLDKLELELVAGGE